MVELSMKVSIIYTWLVKTLHNMLSSFVLSLVTFYFLMPPTVGCVQYSAPQNTYIAEDQLRCLTLPRLLRSTVLPSPLSLG